MADPLRHVQPGEPFKPSAATWNAFVDAAKAERQRQFDRMSGGPSRFFHTDIVRVHNATGLDLDRFSIVGLNGPLFTPTMSLDAFVQEVTFLGVVPEEAHYGRFAVLLDPAKDEAIARAWLSGVCIAKVDMVVPNHIFADITEGDTSKLKSAGGGAAQILWKESDDGYGIYGAYDDIYSYDNADWQWAIVRLGPKSGQPVHFLSPVGGIAARTGSGPFTPGVAECSIMMPAGGGTVGFAGVVDIYNDSDIDVTGDAEGWAVWGEDGRLYAITEYCPPDAYY